MPSTGLMLIALVALLVSVSLWLLRPRTDTFVANRLLCVDGTLANWFAAVVYGAAMTHGDKTAPSMRVFMRSFARDVSFQCDSLAYTILGKQKRSLPQMQPDVSKYCFGVAGTQADAAAQMAYDVALQVYGGSMLREDKRLTVEDVAEFWWRASRELALVAYS